MAIEAQLDELPGDLLQADGFGKVSIHAQFYGLFSLHVHRMGTESNNVDIIAITSRSSIRADLFC